MPTESDHINSQHIDSLIESWRLQKSVAYTTSIEKKSAEYQPLKIPLPTELESLFPTNTLWSHQAEAIDLLRDKTNVVLASGTGSGKSLCYQIPIAEAFLLDATATTLALFPTKALAQDQLRSFNQLNVVGMKAVTYDGDTDHRLRTSYRKNANIVLTNPDMLHHAILPYHKNWGTFLHRLQFVIFDELHVARGIFGSHISHVMRRLLRLCSFYGSSPTLITTSATIGNPKQLAENIFAKPFTAITKDGSPQGKKTLVFYSKDVPKPAQSELQTSPSNVRYIDDSLSQSSFAQTAHVTSQIIKTGMRTVVFAKSRQAAEILCDLILNSVPKEYSDKIEPYRAGFLAAERREIEHKLFTGQLLCVVATSALELGIDIGNLDACVLHGFPGTISSFWQQTGRCGRALQPSLLVMVNSDDPLDTWFMQYPKDLLDRDPESCVINPANPYVLYPQISCAAYEKPLTKTDERWWPELLEPAIHSLTEHAYLTVRPLLEGKKYSGQQVVWSMPDKPHRHVGIRTSSIGEITVYEDSLTPLGTVDAYRAAQVLHPGAIYLHHGKRYRVLELTFPDLQNTHASHHGEAQVELCFDEEITQPLSQTSVTIIDSERHIQDNQITHFFGTIEIANHVTKYRRINTFTRTSLGTYDIDMPMTTMQTSAWWITFPREFLDVLDLEDDRIAGGIHAVEHAILSISPVSILCDRWDLGGYSTLLHTQTDATTLFIHDAYPGGTGNSREAFENKIPILLNTLQLIVACSCSKGCPNCIQSPKCGNGNNPLDKHAAICILQAVLLENENDIDMQKYPKDQDFTI